MGMPWQGTVGSGGDLKVQWGPEFDPMKVMPSNSALGPLRSTYCVCYFGPSYSPGDRGRKEQWGRVGKAGCGGATSKTQNTMFPAVARYSLSHRTLALPTCHLITCHSPQGKVGRGAGEEGRGGGHQNTASCPLGTSLSQGWSRGPSKQVSKSLVSILLGTST